MPNNSTHMNNQVLMEFVASSRKYCALIEQTGMYTLKEFINQIHLLLPELYLKGLHFPHFRRPV